MTPERLYQIYRLSYMRYCTLTKGPPPPPDSWLTLSSLQKIMWEEMAEFVTKEIIEESRDTRIPPELRIEQLELPFGKREK